MRKCRHSPPASRMLCKSRPELLFWSTVLISVLTTWYVTGHFLDSDAASEMVLAQHWIQSGNILSRDWIYGSEYRIIHQQLVFAPLMLFLDDWRLIRFIGTLILQGIYILSYRFLCWQAGLSRKVFYISATLLLLPASVAYGRIVLYHCHYIPNIALSYLMIGLILGSPERFSLKNPRHILRAGLLAACSFLGSLSGVRQLMITHGPVLLSVVTLALVEDSLDGERRSPALLERRYLRMLTWAAGSALFALMGLKVNSDILGKYLTQLVEPGANTLAFADGDVLSSILYGYFHQFGFRTDVPMVSFLGILSLAGVFAGGYLLWLAAARLDASGEIPVKRRLLGSVFLCYTGIMVLVFIVTGGNQRYYHVLYLSLCQSWAIPLLVTELEDNPGRLYPLHTRRLFAWLTILILVCSGGVNLLYFNGSDAVEQKYEGIMYPVRDKKAQLAGAVEYLQENSYTLGLATYWEGNILTEMTDGEIIVANIYLNDTQNSFAYFDCLTQIYNREMPVQRKFLLVGEEYADCFESSEEYRFCRPVYRDAWHRIYDVTDQEGLNQALYY